MSYAEEKLRLAALKLRGRGGPASRARKALSDLSAVFERDFPANAWMQFQAVKQKIASGGGDQRALAAELDHLAAMAKNTCRE